MASDSKSDLTFDPTSLPIYDHAGELLDAVANHRVVVVEGPTGSGKTTQLPKILLDAQLANGLMVGVTQPRRIAAVSVAWRIAEERGGQLGDEVGYTIRFDDMTSAATRIKIMTDGILLQEARTDALFSRYGVIVIDEAHERTLNIDFSLGLLRRALQQRDDLRVVVSSATLDPETFRRYFEPVVGKGRVPMVSIDARPFEVDVQYRPQQHEDMDAVVDAVCSEVSRIERAGEPGGALVFLSGEAMIKKSAQMLTMGPMRKALRVLPLYGKLTRAEQERIFLPTGARRKIVLATNIAETSITVPDIRFVIDSGLAKVPRVQSRTGISVLREEGISRSSADQRAGRAGRTAPGTCVRLYSRKSYATRPEFTDEEILRLDLSGVVLRLIDLGVTDVERFALPTAPPRKALRKAIAALQAMGAIDQRRELTAVGRRMVPFPLSPSLARMVVEAADRFFGVVNEVLMVGAFMSARSPFLYPQGEESEARAAQRTLAHPSGDAMTAVKTLKRYLKAKDPEKFCETSYLDPNTMAFIAKAHRQLRDIAEHHGIDVRGGGEPSLVVRCVAAGFAHQIMKGRGRVFEGPGESTIAIHPSSSLFGARPAFVVAAELVVSARAYARSVSVVQPEWIAELNPDLARRWHLSTRKRTNKRRVDESTLPSSLRVAQIELPISVKRGRPTVTVTAEAAGELSGIGLQAVPARALNWKAELRQDRFKWGRGMKLGRLLCLLPHLPLPDKAPQPIRDVPQGALLDVERNLHTLGRFVSRLLEPGLPQRGRYPGWLTLVSNGESGFWFEVVSDFPDALTTSLVALRDLARALPPGDALEAQLADLIARFETRDIELGYALAAARRFTR